MKKEYRGVCKRRYQVVKDGTDLKIFISPFSPKELWLRMEPYEAVRDSMRE